MWLVEALSSVFVAASKKANESQRKEQNCSHMIAMRLEEFTSGMNDLPCEDHYLNTLSLQQMGRNVVRRPTMPELLNGSFYNDPSVVNTRVEDDEMVSVVGTNMSEEETEREWCEVSTNKI